MVLNERRLGDRILAALDMALEQGHLDVAEHLALALEATLTRFGGPGAVDHRDLSLAMAQAFERLGALRRQARDLPPSGSGAGKTAP